MDDDTRLCARGPRCASRGPDDQPAPTPRPFCDADRDLIEAAIRAMPALYVRQEQIMRTPSFAAPLDAVRVSATPALAVPIRLEPEAIQREMVEVLVSWEERVRDVARLTPLDTATSRHRRGGVAVQQACDVLATRVDALIALPPAPMLRAGEIADLSGVDAGLEILALHWRARAGLPETGSGTRALPVPCGNCGWRALREILDVLGLLDGARCRRCGATYDVEGLAALRRAALDKAKAAAQ